MKLILCPATVLVYMTTQFNTCIKQWLGFNLFVVAVSVYVLPCFFAKKKKKKKKKKG